MVTQSLLIGLSLALGVLTATNIIRFWMLAAAAFLSGAVLSFDQPARNALLPLLVPQKEMLNAISLQSLIFNGTSVIGPSLAGLTAQAFGFAANFFLNALSYSSVILALLLIRFRENGEAGSPASVPRPHPSIRSAMLAVRKDEILPMVLVLYGALLFFAPSSQLLLPAFADSVVHLSAGRLGLLFSAMGVGTILGSLVFASLPPIDRKTTLLPAGFAVWTVSLLGFAWTRSLWPAAAALVFLGASQAGISATAITLLQERVDVAMRGRIMGLNTLLIMGVRPMGDFPAGALINWIGVPATATISAAFVGASALGALPRAIARGKNRLTPEPTPSSRGV